MVRKKQNFIQGAITIMISQVLIKIFGLIYKVYLTNKEGFGDAGNAIYNSGFQIYALLLTLSSIGVPNAISKLVSEKLAYKDKQGADLVFKVAIVIFGIIGGFASFLLFLGADFLANYVLNIPEATQTLKCLSPSIFFVSISSVIRGYFNGYNNMNASATSQALEQIFKTIFTIIIVAIIGLITSSNTIFMAAGANLATSLATLLSFIYLVFYYKYKNKTTRIIGISVNKKKESLVHILKSILAISVPISLSSLMAVITKNIDAVTVVSLLKNIMPQNIAQSEYGILARESRNPCVLTTFIKYGFFNYTCT